jgi:glucuronate isomerase
MKKFLGKNFILQTKTAKILYHEFAKKMPIIDYHCHLPVDQIAQDRQFENMTQIWLNGDHYKWRAMRTNGVAEKFITGNATDWEKFEKWASTVPFTIRNPLYHWTHLELKSPFGIDKILDPHSAPKIYKEASKMLQTKEFSVRNIMQKMNVEAVCTTDDPIDSLEHHQKIKKDKFKVKVYPAWRPDKAMTIEDPIKYNTYVSKLEEVAQMSISTFSDLIFALKKRHDFFHNNDCRISDHGLEEFYNEEYTESTIDRIFEKVRSGKTPDTLEIRQFKTAMLYEFAVMDFEKGWVQQFHIGALRNNNTRMFNSIGPDTGFDSIGDWNVAANMSRFLDRLDREGKLTKTILYNLNPKDNEVMATMLGNFQDGSVPGKIQWGSGWWFLDQKDGMERHMNALSSLGLLSRFVGMLTDSRSFLSYPRHEYFRRILCNLLGNDVEKGEIPNDIDLLGKIVEDISYNNAKNYFNFPA